MAYNFLQELGETGAGDAGGYRIFISHSSRDKELVTAFVELLEGLGLNQKHIFCSSVPGYGIPLGEDIYDYLRDELTRKKIYVIFFLSESYYQSAACLNEMGAAWVLRSGYLAVLQPGFTFQEAGGAVNPRAIALDLNGGCRDGLNGLYEKLQTMFRLEGSPYSKWERCRDRFICRMRLLFPAG